MNENEKKKQEPQDEMVATRSGLGKEAKIGVAVVLVLAIVLGVVVVRRVMGPRPGDMASVAAEDNERGEDGKEKDKSPRDGHGDPANKDGKSKHAGPGLTTVLQAQGSPAKPPKAGDGDPWKKLRGDKPEPKPALGSGGPPMAPPPFPPATPKPEPALGAEPPTPPVAESGPRYGADPLASRDPIGHRPKVENDPLAASPPEPAFRQRADEREHNAAPRHPGAADRGRAIANEPPPSDAMILGGPAQQERPRNDDGRLRPRSEPAIPPLDLAGADRQDTLPARSPRAFGNSNEGRPASDMVSYAANENRNPPRPPARHRGTEPRRDDGKYEVQPNDNYSTISEKLYGTSSFFKALAEHNRSKVANEDQLKPGDLIDAPPLAQLEQAYPNLCPKPERREALQGKTQTVGTRAVRGGGRAYTVMEGDTLFNIARYELGKASRWAEIYDLNRETLGKDFNYLTPGTQLMLPQGEKEDMQARKSSDRVR